MSISSYSVAKSSLIFFLFLLTLWLLQAPPVLAKEVRVLLLDNTYHNDLGLTKDRDSIAHAFSYILEAGTVEEALTMIRRIGKKDTIRQLVFLGHGLQGTSSAEFGSQSFNMQIFEDATLTSQKKGDSSLLDAFADNAEVVFYNCYAGETQDLLRSCAEALLAFSGGTVYAHNEGVESQTTTGNRLLFVLAYRGLISPEWVNFESPSTVPYTRFNHYRLAPFPARDIQPQRITIEGPENCSLDAYSKGELLSDAKLLAKVPPLWCIAGNEPFIEYEWSRIGRQGKTQKLESGVNKKGYNVTYENNDQEVYVLKVFLSNGMGRRLLGEARHTVDFYALEIRLSEENPKIGEVITARARCVKGSPEKDSYWNWKTAGDLKIVAQGDGAKNDEKQIKISGTGEITAILYRTGDFGKEQVLAWTNKEVRPGEATIQKPSTIEPQDVDPAVRDAIARKDWRKLRELKQHYKIKKPGNAQVNIDAIDKALRLIGEEKMQWLMGYKPYFEALKKANQKALEAFKEKVRRNHEKKTDTGATVYDICSAGKDLDECLRVPEEQWAKENRRIEEAMKAIAPLVQKGQLLDPEKAEQIEKQYALPCPYPAAVISKLAFTAPCISGAATKLKVELIPSKKGKLAPGEHVEVNAVINGAKPGDEPFSYTWSGDHAGKGSTVTFFSSTPGKKTLRVLVKSARGESADARIEFEVKDVKVTITMTPHEKKLPVGSKAAFTATVMSGGKPLAGNFVFRWETNSEVSFTLRESGSPMTGATFKKPDTVKVWVVVLKKEGNALNTLAESEQIVVEIGEPKLTMTFAPPEPLVGQQVKARVTVAPESKGTDFRWETPGNVHLVTESQDTREIVLVPRDTKPAVIIARGRVPISGEDLGQARGTVTARPFKVIVKVIGPLGPPPLAWDGKSHVEKKSEIAVHQNVRLTCEIAPAPPGELRYQWSLNEDSHFDGNCITRDVMVNRSQVGPCVATVVIRNAEGLELGKGTGTFSVSISAEAISKGKENKEKAEKLKKEAESLISQGKFDAAEKVITGLEKLDPAAAKILREKLAAECLKRGWEACRRDYDYDRGVPLLEKAVALAPTKEAQEKLALAQKAAPLAREMKRLAAQGEALVGEKKLFSAREVVQKIDRIDNQQMPFGLGGNCPEKKRLMELCGRLEEEYNVSIRDYHAKYEALADAKNWEAAKKLVLAMQKWQHSPSLADELKTTLAKVEHHLERQRDIWKAYQNVKSMHEQGALADDARVRKEWAGSLRNFSNEFGMADSRRKDLLDLVAALEKARELKVSVKASKSSLEIGGKVDIIAKASGGVPPYKYEWYGNGKKRGNHTTESTAVDIHFTPESPGSHSYQVVVTDSAGNKGEAECSLTVQSQAARPSAPLRVSLRLNSRSVYSGDRLVTEADAQGGTPPYTYQWYFKSLQNRSRSVESWTFSSTGSNTCKVVVTDSEGHSASATADFTILEKSAAASALSSTLKPTRSEIELGESHGLDVRANGGAPPYRFTWYENSTRLDHISNDTIGIKNTPRRPGTYHFEVVTTDSAGNSSTARCTVLVKGQAASLAAPLSMRVEPSEASATQGEKLTLRARAEGGVPPYRYEWYQYGKVSEVRASGIVYTLNKTGRRTINAVVYDSTGNRAEGVCWVTVSASSQSSASPHSTSTQSSLSDNALVRNQNVYVTYKNHSSENIHLFASGQTFSPANRFAPGEQRTLRFRVGSDGRVTIYAGRNGQIFARKNCRVTVKGIQRNSDVIYRGGGRLEIGFE